MDLILSKGVRFDKISCLCILHSDVYYIVNLMRISTPFFIKVAQRQVQKESLSKRTLFDKKRATISDCLKSGIDFMLLLYPPLKTAAPPVRNVLCLYHVLTE